MFLLKLALIKENQKKKTYLYKIERHNKAFRFAATVKAKSDNAFCKATD